MSAFPPIAQLMPHRGPMVLLERMLSWSPGQTECGMQVRAGTRFVEEDGLRAPFTIEHMAQSVAACLGYEAYLGGRGVRVGMIVSCRTFYAHMPSASVGDELVVKANRERGNESLSHFDCEVRKDKALFATASLTLFHGETLTERAL